MSKKRTPATQFAARPKDFVMPSFTKELEELLSKSTEDNSPMGVSNGTPQSVEQYLSSAAGQEKAHPSPTVPPEFHIAEDPNPSNPSEKEVKTKNKTSVASHKSKAKNVKGKKSIETGNSDTTAAVSTPEASPVDKATRETKDKTKGNRSKPKTDTKKKEKHKPFRRGHDLDMDSKVKSEFFSMRLSGKELDSLSKKAAKCHMSTSTDARETLLSSVPREALSEKDRNTMDNVYTMLENANFHVRQMANYFHSMLSEKDKGGKAKYDGLTWKELKVVIQKQKAVLDFLDNEFRIYK